MLDVVTLNDGQILLITDETLALYENRSDFEANTRARVLFRRRQ